MAAEIPTAEEIMQRAEQVMQTARRVRVEQELDPQAMGNRGAAAQAQREAVREDGYTWVLDVFEHNLGPDPIGFDEPIAVMHEAESKLYDRDSQTLPIDGFLEDLRDYLGSSHWDGGTANSFRTNFLNRIEEVTKNQSLVAFTLRHALVAEKELYVRVRQNLKETAEQTIVALEALEDFCEPGRVAVTLSVVSAVAATAAAAATLGTAAPAAIAAWSFVAGATSGAAGVVGSHGDPHGPPRELQAETVDGVLRNMTDIVGEVQEEVYRQEREIISVLRDDLDVMTDGRSVTFPDGGERSPSENFLAARPDNLIEPAERASDASLPDADRDEATEEVFEGFRRR